MATPAKKRRRRLMRKGRLDLLASADSPLELVSQVTAADVAADPDAVQIEAAAGDGDDGSRRPATFKANAYSGGPMTPRMAGALSTGTPIVVDLRGMRIARNGRQTPVLFSHDKTDPVGHTNSVTVGTSVRAEGILSVPGDSRDKVVGAARDGFRWAISVGVEATELEALALGETATVNGRTVRGPIYIARKSQLKEISFLAVGADPPASATVSATSATPPTAPNAPTESDPMPEELRAYIEASGFNPDEVSDGQIEYFKAQHAAKIEAEQGDGSGAGGNGLNDLSPGIGSQMLGGGSGSGQGGSQGAATGGGQTVDVQATGGNVDPIAERRAQFAAEIERCRVVASICAEYGSPTIKIQGKDKSLESVAIEAGWDEDKVTLEAMRASRDVAPAGRVSGRDQTHTLDALTCGLMMRSGVNIEASHFQGVQAIEAGSPGWLVAGTNSDQFQRTAENARRFRSASLLEIAATAVEIESGQRPHGRTAVIEAAFSSGNFAKLIGTSVGARALEAFNEVPDTTQGWVSRTTVPDFEQHDRAGLDAMESLDHLPPGQLAAHAKQSAHGEKVQAARYAKQYVIDEQHLVGDRLDLLSRVPRQMGKAAARLIPDLVYWLLLSNPTMARTGRTAFNSTDGTLATAAAFDKAPLQALISSLMQQQDGDAVLNLQPTHLMTGTELADAVVQLTGSAVFSNDSGEGARNPLARYGIQPVADARLSTGVRHPQTKVLASGSTTAYWLHSTDGEGIEVQTVDGTGGIPRVRVSNLTQGGWGLHVDVKHDVGAAMVENRTWRKNAGA